MSSTPVVAWSFALPSATATRPSATIGLCQWTLPVRELSRPAGRSSGRRRRRRRRLRRREGCRRRPATCRRRGSTTPACSRPPRRSSASVPASVDEEHPFALPHRRLAEHVDAARDGQRLQLAARPRAGPRQAMQVEQPELPVLAALHREPAASGTRGSSSRDRDRTCSGARGRRASSGAAAGTRRTRARARCRPSRSCRRTARCRSRRPASRWRDRPRRRSATRSPSRSTRSVFGTISACRSEQSEFHTCAIRPGRLRHRHDVPLVRTARRRCSRRSWRSRARCTRSATR